MKTNVDSCFRLTVPIQAIKSLKSNAGEYAKIELRKGPITDYFYLRIPSKSPSRRILQVRRKLPQKIIYKMQLTPHDTLEIVKISKIKKVNSIGQLNRGKFDLLALQIDNIMAESFSRNNEEWCRFWSSSKNGGFSNFIEMKRFIPINRKTGEFFGLIQAESRKVIGKFEFTNTLIDAHKQVIDVAENLGISRSLWNVGIIRGKTASKSYVESCKNKFLQETKINKVNYEANSKTLLSIAYQIYISCQVLNKLMNKTLVILRNQIIDEFNIEPNNNYEDFCKGFITKYLLGDGSITFPSQTNVQIFLTEADAESRKSFQSMLSLFGIKSFQRDIRVYVSTDIDSLLWFLENNLFVGHVNNRKKLLEYVIRNYYIRTAYERLLKVNNVTIDEYANFVGLSYETASMSLHRYKKRGFLQTKKISGKTIFCLTEKGMRFIELIKQAEIEYLSSLNIAKRKKLTDTF